MWLHQELDKVKINSLSVRQQLDLLQDNAYVICNLNSLVHAHLSFGQSNTTTASGLSALSRLQREINITWNNIYAYIATYFPSVWSEVGESTLFPKIPIIFGKQFEPKILEARIRSCQQFIEICKTLVYGGSLRLPFSQNSVIINIHQKLLCSCQISDISGKASIAGQRRIIFLRNWIQKLVVRHSLQNFLLSTTNFSPFQCRIKTESVPITETKSYVVKEIPIQTCPLIQSDSKVLSKSSSSVNTTFTSYLNQQNRNSSKFIGLKLKFDSELSDDDCSTINSDDSIWETTFKRQKS